MRAVVVVVAVISLATPCASASAQAACEEGRVPVEGGYCCWPGQAADASGECAGPPSCPPDRVASGRDCTLRATAPAEGAAPRGNVMDDGLVIAGSVLIGVGYVGAVITAIALGTQTQYGNPCPGCPAIRFAPLPNWPVGFVPLVHAFGAIGSIGNGSYDDIFVIGTLLGTGCEIAGAILVTVGAIGNAPSTSAASLDLGPIRLRAPGADAGLSVVGTF